MQKLSKYAEQLSVSDKTDKRRYLEKIKEIGDPYSIFMNLVFFRLISYHL